MSIFLKQKKIKEYLWNLVMNPNRATSYDIGTLIVMKSKGTIPKELADKLIYKISGRLKKGDS